jgi:hypothetical protein
MATVLELVDRLDRLRGARARGVHEVQTADGRRITYKSDAEMAAASADIERQITVMSGVPITSILVASSKELDS